MTENESSIILAVLFVVGIIIGVNSKREKINGFKAMVWSLAIAEALLISNGILISLNREMTISGAIFQGLAFFTIPNILAQGFGYFVGFGITKQNRNSD